MIIETKESRVSGENPYGRQSKNWSVKELSVLGSLVSCTWFARVGDMRMVTQKDCLGFQDSSGRNKELVFFLLTFLSIHSCTICYTYLIYHDVLCFDLHIISVVVLDQDQISFPVFDAYCCGCTMRILTQDWWL